MIVLNMHSILNKLSFDLQHTIFSGNIKKLNFPIFIWRTFCFFFNLKPTVELNLSYCDKYAFNSL